MLPTPTPTPATPPDTPLTSPLTLQSVEEPDVEEEAQGADDDSNSSDGSSEGQGIYCQECETWLNGPNQYKDHLVGRKHKANCNKAKMAAEDKAAHKVE